jgi:hypothetical protein
LLWFFLAAADERGMDGAQNPGPSQLGEMKPRTGTRRKAKSNQRIKKEIDVKSEEYRKVGRRESGNVKGRRRKRE